MMQNRIEEFYFPSIILPLIGISLAQVFFLLAQQLPIEFQIKLQQSINKLNSRSFSMIRANRQTIPDRRLFENIHKHNNVLEIDCQPDNHTDLSFVADKMFHNMYRIFKQKFQELDRKVGVIDSQIHRLHAMIKYKRQGSSGKIYSFANSPNDKPTNKTPDSAKKYYNQTNYPQNSTQPKTQSRSKEKQEQISYLSEQIESLHQQVLLLKDHIDRTHSKEYFYQNLSNLKTQKAISKENDINFNNINIQKRRQYSDKNPLLKIPYQSDLYDIIGPLEMNQKQIQDETISRYKNIILQYKKQEEILRIMAGKAQKYRECLRKVNNWLRNLKQVQFQKFLPCQACKIKQFVRTFLTESHRQHSQQKYKKNELKYPKKLTSYQQEYIDQSETEKYEIMEGQDEDQLLVQYQNESDDQLSLS